MLAAHCPVGLYDGDMEPAPQSQYIASWTARPVLAPQNRGWTLIINDDLIGMALGIVNASVRCA
jgi:hypothetical protein